MPEKLNITPFVKWAGGKRQILNELRSYMPATYNRYYEPFIGGGALLFDQQPKNAVINDINEQLLNVYKQLKINDKAVISALKGLDSIECSKDYYLDNRTRYNEKIKAGILDPECAALTIWINKHCFNGLYRVNSKGLFNVPWNNKVNGVSMDEKNLRSIGLYLNSSNIDIREGDFECACADVQPGDFVYFDSPYISMSNTANFVNYTKDGFSYEDHCRLAELVKKLDSIGAKVMLSNNDTDLVHELYGDFAIYSFPVKRMINRNASGRIGKEVIIVNY